MTLKDKKFDYDVTIAITNYNRVEFLDRSIRSCLEQISTFNQKIEIIVIDDCSTDSSIEFLKNYQDKIRLYKNKKNMGVGYCSNLAVKKAKGKLFIRVDSDDYLGRLATEIMSNILRENKKLSFVYCDHIRVDRNGFKEEKVRLDSDIKLRNHGAGVMFRTKIIRDIGNYRRDLREGEDYDLIKRLHEKRHKSFYLPIPLYRYYIHEKNLSKTGDRQFYINKINAK